MQLDKLTLPMNEPAEPIFIFQGVLQDAVTHYSTPAGHF